MTASPSFLVATAWDNEGMQDPNALLTTLSQSSAVMVAIIGGFLVSRLVALSRLIIGLQQT